MERRRQRPPLPHRNPQVDGSTRFLDFSGLAALQAASFHIMACMVCMRQVPARSRRAAGTSDSRRQDESSCSPLSHNKVSCSASSVELAAVPLISSERNQGLHDLLTNSQRPCMLLYARSIGIQSSVVAVLKSSARSRTATIEGPGRRRHRSEGNHSDADAA